MCSLMHGSVHHTHNPLKPAYIVSGGYNKENFLHYITYCSLRHLRAV